MEIKQEYQQPLNNPPQKTFFSLVISVLAFLLIPFKFTKDKLILLKKDNDSRRKYLAWHKRENTRYRRGIKLNDEF